MSDNQHVPAFGQDVSFIRDNHLFRLRAAAIILHDNHVLMARNQLASYYYSIGGAVHLGESVEDALRREVQEETGLALPVKRLVAVHQNFFQDDELGKHNWHEVAFYYLMDYQGQPINSAGSLSMLDSPETLHWLPLDRFEEYHAYPLFFADLPQMLNQTAPAMIVSQE